MHRQLTDRQIEAYEIGQTYRGMTLRRAWEAEMYGEDRIDAMAPIEAACFDAGVRGDDLPRHVTGWRYGKIPASGYSRNHRDQQNEVGVSLMAIDGEEDETDGTFALFNGDRPVVRISGFLLGRRGSDGEPLVIGAREITENETEVAA